MHRYIKKGVSLLLCLSLLFAVTACSKAVALTEENITKTVALVEKALRDFDRDSLQKYVSSKTLNYIFQFANGKEEFNTLGKLLFEKLEISVASVDLENNKVTLQILNRDMAIVGERYSKLLQTRSHGKTAEMLKLLSDDEFLDISLRSLTAQISRATVPDNPTEVTVGVKQEKKNLVLVFGEEADNAASGGIVKAITEAFSPTAATTTKQN